MTAAPAIARACAMGYNFKEIQRFPSKWPIQPCAGTVAGLRPTSGRITFWLKSAVRSAAGASLPAPRSSGRRTGRRGCVAVVCRPWRESARGRGGRGRPASCATSNGGTAVECKLGGRGVGSAAGSTCGRQRSSRWRSSSWRPARTSERAATGDVEPRGLPHAEEKRPEPSLRGGWARPRREIRRPTDFNIGWSIGRNTLVLNGFLAHPAARTATDDCLPAANRCDPARGRPDHWPVVRPRAARRSPADRDEGETATKGLNTPGPPPS